MVNKGVGEGGVSLFVSRTIVRFEKQILDPEKRKSDRLVAALRWVPVQAR